jgi:hypothetical protein
MTSLLEFKAMERRRNGFVPRSFAATGRADAVPERERPNRLPRNEHPQRLASRAFAGTRAKSPRFGSLGGVHMVSTSL